MLLSEFANPRTITDYDVGKTLIWLRDKGATEYIRDVLSTRKILYRGISKTVSKPMFTANSPTNRQPRGQSLENQKTLDFILKNSGFTALRSNSISCTDSLHAAQSFGYAYMIFPHNGFAYTWSAIADVGINVALKNDLNHIYDDYARKRIGIPRKVLNDFIEKWEFSKENLAEALVSGKEVIISGKYTAINAFRFTELAEHTLGIKFKSWLDE